VRKGNAGWVLVGALAGVLAYRWGTHKLNEARAAARPYEKPILTDAYQLLEILRPLWRHPEALAMTRADPVIGAPLTETVLAALVQGDRADEPLWADSVLAWLAAPGRRLRKRRDVSPDEPSEEQLMLVAALARETLAAGGMPPRERLEELIGAFGTRTARDVVTYVRLVTAIVLITNTCEALGSRLLGKPAPNSRALGEVEVLAILVLGVWPLVPVALLRTLINPAG
jgi:hypothetical protein